MKKKFVYASSLCAALALIAFTACKKSSSSSSSGSVTGAMATFADYAFTNSGVKSSALAIRPRGSSCQSPVSGSLTYTQTTTGTANCPSGDTLYTLTGSETIAISSCVANGYTFSGQFSFGPGSNAYNVCISTSNSLVSMGGGITLQTTSPLSITGNGFQGQTCSVDLALAMSESNGTYSGSVTGTACSQTINSSF